MASQRLPGKAVTTPKLRRRVKRGVSRTQRVTKTLAIPTEVVVFRGEMWPDRREAEGAHSLLSLRGQPQPETHRQGAH